MNKLTKGGLMTIVATLSLATAQAAQFSNIVGYHTATVLGNSDAVISSPYDNAAGIKTFNQLFPANLSGLSYSNSTPGASGRRTEVLVLQYNTVGENKSPADTYFYQNSGWRRQGASLTVNFGASNVVNSAQYVILRNRGNAGSLTYVAHGTLEQGALSNSIPTAAVKNDLYVSPGRATTLTFDDLQLGGTAAFVTSTPGASGRKDELLTFNNGAAGLNKSPADTFFYQNNSWRRQGSSLAVDYGRSNVVNGAQGFLIRKAVGTPGSANWSAIPTY